MREETARTLSRVTSEFYARTSASFGATRAAPWAGWERVLHEAMGRGAAPQACRVLDLACGNLRFERFLSESDALRHVESYCYDSCDELADVGKIDGVEVCYTHVDLAERLLSDESADLQVEPGCDLSVCFGFMHHLPLTEQRARALRVLVASTRLGGLIAVSFWQLSQSERLLRKARETTARAVERLDIDDLGAGDYLLGWQDRSDVLRYCHDFAEAEIDALAAAVEGQAREVARFSADGATGTLNRYLLLQRDR